jgi:hypothetical protein
MTNAGMRQSKTGIRKGQQQTPMGLTSTKVLNELFCDVSTLMMVLRK